MSACVWCVKLYSTVLAGCVVLFSFLWVIGHSYVLSVTEEGTLRVQRWVTFGLERSEDTFSLNDILSLDTFQSSIDPEKIIRVSLLCSIKS